MGHPQDVSQFQIFRGTERTTQQKREADTVATILPSIRATAKLIDVTFGDDPPDFVFHFEDGMVGVELTTALPKKFGSKGYAKKAEFTTWKDGLKQNPEPRHEFCWGRFTLAATLEALEFQLADKSADLERWKPSYSQRWLMLFVDSGASFGSLVSHETETVGGREEEWADYEAKVVYEVQQRCAKTAFDYVVFFSGIRLFSFPKAGNPRSLSVPSAETIMRGRCASTDFLKWTSTNNHVTEHPFLKR